MSLQNVTHFKHPVLAAEHKAMSMKELRKEDHLLVTGTFRMQSHSQVRSHHSARKSLPASLLFCRPDLHGQVVATKQNTAATGVHKTGLTLSHTHNTHAHLRAAPSIDVCLFLPDLLAITRPPV